MTERLRERVSEATRSYPDDGPEYQRGVRSRQWLTKVAPDAIALLADMADHLKWLSDGTSHELLLRLDALCGDER